MPECDYCDRAFDDEDAYVEHLGSEHEGELGRIDQRRVEQHRSGGGVSVPPTVIYGVAGLLVLALLGGVVYYTIGAFQPEEDEQFVHEHGTIEVVIDGERVDLHQFPDETAFHFHRGDPNWHMESRGRLTLSEAFGHLGIELTADRLEIGDETYDATQPGVELSVRVNGEPVDPESYELHGVGPGRPADQGDHVEIVVETES